MRMLRLIITTLTLATLTACVPTNEAVTGAAAERAVEDEWFTRGRQTVEARLALRPNTNRAKNVILFVGDGMGISTITAGRIFDGQSRGESGEENSLSFETFPHVALVKTYNTDAQTPDSAGTASAMNTGVKTRIRVINLWSDQHDCYGPVTAFPPTLAELAEQRGMATGVVSTARVTHATPAAVYGHSPSRAWESDADIPPAERGKGCRDLADQLVNFPHGDGIDLVLGGGQRVFVPAEEGGSRTDKRNLLQEWESKSPANMLLADAGELRQQARAAAAGDRNIIGLFNRSHMAYEADRNNAEEPSLAEMTEFAIDHLAASEQGYFLMVEGARIDHAHHVTNAHRALRDTQAFAGAVATALSKVDLEDTLILVTADHSHVFTIAGYPPRGNPILGLVRDNGPGGQAGLTAAEDGKPYATLGYYNGPNLRTDTPLTDAQAGHLDFQQQAAVLRRSETHGGEDVALFATGASAYLVGGVIEQNVIFHLMTRALGWDD